MSLNTKVNLPIELLPSIFNLVQPESLAVLMRCNTCFYEICNPLFYREVHLHTPIQLVRLSNSQKATQASMLRTTETLLVDDFALYLESWENIDVEYSSDPFHYLLIVLHATTSLSSLKITQSKVTKDFFRRADRIHKHNDSSGVLSTFRDPKFLPNLSLISVFSPYMFDGPKRSYFYGLCYGRVIECYSTWANKKVFVAMFPGLGKIEATTLGPQLASSPERHVSSGRVGQLIRQSIDADIRLNVNRLVLLLKFPGVVLNNEPSPIHDTYSWLKDVLTTAELPHLQTLSATFESLPLDWEIGLEAQRLGVEKLQTVAPRVSQLMLSSNKTLWKKWTPAPGDISLYPAVPDWTPYPSENGNPRRDPLRESFLWWFNAMGLDILGTQDQMLKREFVKQLSEAMCERWDYRDYRALTSDSIHRELEFLNLI